MRQMRTPMDASRHGLAFANRFAWPERGESRAMHAGVSRRFAYGLCGGMSYTVLDYYHAGLMPPAMHQPPQPGTALYRYLLRRQWDSWHWLSVPLRTLAWMGRSDRWAARQTLWHTLPRLLERLDRGEPLAVLLVRTGKRHPTHNHQAVVTGYSLDDTEQLTLWLYDPNHPGADVTLRMNASRASERLDPVQSTGEPLRGLFLAPYRPRTEGLPAG